MYRPGTRAMALFVLTCTFSIALAAVAWAAAPINDDFDNAFLVFGNKATVYGTNLDATTETAEPIDMAGANRGGASVWWRWVAPLSGPVTVETAGSDFDTVLGVYTGTAVDGLVLVATDDDVSASDQSSLVTFTATKGSWYSIGVAGAAFTGPPATGNIKLGIGLKPDIDAFARSQVIADPSGHVYESGYNQNCTTETGEPQVWPPRAGSGGSGATVWYTYTPPFSGQVIVHTGGSDFDTVLGVYTGTSVGALTKVGQSDDAFWPSGPDQVEVNVTAGTTYRIQVGGAPSTPDGSPATGAYVLQIDPVVSTPAISPPPGLHTYPVRVAITCPTSGAVIKYTLDGSVPTMASATFTGPFTLSANDTVMASAFRTGWTDSVVAQAIYRIRCRISTPAPSPSAPRAMRLLTLGGTIAPRVSGRTTKIYVQRKVGRGYRPYLRLAARNTVDAGLMAYRSARIRLKGGSYRVKATYTDATHAASTSPWGIFRVR